MDSDIEAYNWSQQAITLTLEASARFEDTFSADDLQSWQMLDRLFVATLDGNRLYGGAFHLGPMSPAVFELPWIIPEFRENRLVLRLYSGFMGLEDFQAAVKNRKVHDFFLAQGKLVE